MAKNLIEKGAKLNIYDPMVPGDKIKADLKECLYTSKLKMYQVNKLLNNITISESISESFKGVDAIVIITNCNKYLK